MSTRAELILHSLCICVRLLSKEQAMRLTGFKDEANCRRFIRGLRAAGLVNELTVWAKPVPAMKEPLFSSDPRDDPGSLQETIGQILSLARARWAGVPALPTRVLAATDRAGKIYGVRRSKLITHPLTATHDLAVSEAFLAVAPGLGPQDWRGEDCPVICPIQDAIPDAIIADAEGKPRKIVEVVGEHYSGEKLRRLAEGAFEWGLQYEFW